MPSLSLFRFPVLSCLAVLILGGCAGTLPGGKDTVNAGFYKSGEELKTLVATLEPGMPRDEVFKKLGRNETDFTRLTREEIVTTLFGGREANLPGTQQEQIIFLRGLTGYKFEYKSIKRRHGFTSPITVKTDEAGYDYTLTLVFYDDMLLESPIPSGGLVSGADSKTLFDYLNPGLILSGGR